MSATSPPDQVELRAKANLCALGAHLLAREIDAPLLHWLITTGIVDECPANEWDRALEDLAVEYCRLLIGPRPVCSPYASDHRAGSGLGSQPHKQFELFLARHGLQVTPVTDLRMLATDHIAVEVAAVGILYRRASEVEGADAADSTEAAIHELLRDHVLPWAPQVLRELADSATIPPYNHILPVIAAVLADETTVRRPEREASSLHH